MWAFDELSQFQPTPREMRSVLLAAEGDGGEGEGGGGLQRSHAQRIVPRKMHASSQSENNEGVFHPKVIISLLLTHGVLGVRVQDSLLDRVLPVMPKGPRLELLVGGFAVSACECLSVGFIIDG